MCELVLNYIDMQIKELMGQRNEWNSKAKAEVDEILARLQNSKAEIIKLEEQKLKLTQKERELDEKLREDEVSYEAMVSQFFDSSYHLLYFLNLSWLPKERKLTSLSKNISLCTWNMASLKASDPPTAMKYRGIAILSNQRKNE